MHTLKYPHLLITLALIAPARAATPDTYLGPNLGLWSDPLNWSAGTPNNAAQTFDVFLNASPGTTVTLDTSPTIDTLTITAPNALSILPNRTLTLTAGALSNAGTILLNGTTSALSLTADTSLTGGGTISLLGPQSRIAGINGYRLTTDNIISGQGNIGGSFLKITNTGTITATAGTLTLAPTNATDGFYNLGLLRAAGAALALTGSTYQNAAGTIEASNGSITLNNNVIINGGIINGISAATLTVPQGSSPRLNNVTLQGNLLANAMSPLNLRGVITNEGTLSIGAASTLTLFALGDTGTLTGAGTLLLTDSSSTLSVLSGVIQANPLQSNFVGRGTISGNLFANSGTITATSGSLVLGFANGTNSGLLRADGGTLAVGSLQFGSPKLTNNGIIDARNNAVVILQGSVSGGTLTSSTGGSFVSGTASFSAALANLSTAVPLHVGESGTLSLSGTVVNTGTITLATPTNFGAALTIAPGATVSLTGGGTVLMVPNNSTSAFARISQFFPGTPSDLYTDNTIIGAGTLGSASFALHLSGPVIANTLPGLNIRSPISGNAFSSSALLRADAAPITFSAGSPLLSGPIEAINGGSIAFNAGSPTLTGPITLLNGAITFNTAVSSATTIAGPGSVTLAPGAALTADALNTSALLLGGTLVLRPHGTANSPSSLSALTLAADTANTFTARLELADNPLILHTSSTNKSAALATLAAAVSQGATGTHGITSTATLTDPTHKTTVAVDNALLHLTTFYGQQVDDASLLVLSTYLGDANLDRKVDVSDLGTLATYYGQTVPNGPLQADFNNDGTVDVTDLGMLATNYGAGTNGAPFSLEPDLSSFSVLPSSFPTPIPEPASLFLLALPTLLSAHRRLTTRRT